LAAHSRHQSTGTLSPLRTLSSGPGADAEKAATEGGEQIDRRREMIVFKLRLEQPAVLISITSCR
jgi:hypothetical protein